MAAAASSNALEDLFGSQLTGKDGSSMASSSLSSVELIGIYFSAHWCPPCKQFTPRLVDCYKNVNANGKRFEVIFASSDQDEEQYNHYFAEMPWLSLGFSSSTGEALSSKYKVQGIPTLVFIDPQTGKTITKDGRAAVSEDPDGNDFPWTPKSFWETLGDSEIIGKSEGETISGVQLKEQLTGGYLGIYFSAHWCGPCRAFTPQLVEWYNSKKDSLGAPFEIMFASSDRSTDQFNEYYGEMPWRALAFSNSKVKGKLSNMFQVRGIPTFAIVEVDSGRTVTTTARMGLMSDPEGFPWPKKAHGVLSQAFLSEIQSTPFLLVFSEDDGVAQANLLAGLGESVEAKARESGEEFEMMACTVPKTMDLRGRLRQIMNLEEGDTKMVVLDLSAGCYYASADSNDANTIDQDKVDAFAHAFRNGTLNAIQLTPPSS